MDDFKWYNDDFQNNTSYKQGSQNSSNTGFDGDFYEQPVSKKSKKSKKTIAAAVLSVALAFVICFSGYALYNGRGGNEMSDSLLANLEGPAEQKNQDNNVEKLVTSNSSKVYTTPEVVDIVGPAVVGVVNKTTYTNPYAFYYGQQAGTEIQQGSGSGVIISDDGYVVTNNHVIEGATEIVVILNAGEEYTARLVGSDSKTDLAVLKIDAEALSFAKLGTSSELRVGEKAIAIGNPLGQEFAGTTTQGIISGLNRTIKSEAKRA